MINLILSLLFVFGNVSGDSIIKELPNAKLANFAGEAIDLHSVSKAKGIKIISLWATWCGPCKTELNAVSKVHKSWKEKYGAEVIAISVDNKRGLSRAKKYAAQQGWDFTLLHDTNGELLNALSLEAIPFSMVVDGNGKIISTTEGYYKGYEKDIEKKLKKLSTK